ncbi:hypothetical protein ABEB36_006224 [Hypothenemus hampei]
MIINDDNISNDINTEIENIMPTCTEENAESNETPMQPCTSALGNINEILPSVKKSKRKWSNYTPHKLKEAVSKHLRPTITNPVIVAKEEYLKKKQHI